MALQTPALAVCRFDLCCTFRQCPLLRVAQYCQKSILLWQIAEPSVKKQSLHAKPDTAKLSRTHLPNFEEQDDVSVGLLDVPILLLRVCKSVTWRRLTDRPMGGITED